jgi:hypothetical protein
MLSSTSPQDDISNDLAELLGLDNIELVIKVNENRDTVLEEVISFHISLNSR